PSPGGTPIAEPGVMSPTQAMVTGARSAGAAARRMVATPPAPAPATDATMPTTAANASASEPTATARRRWYVADVGRGEGSETSIPLLASGSAAEGGSLRRHCPYAVAAFARFTRPNPKLGSRPAAPLSSTDASSFD